MKSNKIISNSTDGILVTAPIKDVLKFIKTKTTSFQEIIKKTILAVNKYKFLDILGANDINVCVKSLETLFSQLEEISNDLEMKKK